MKYCIFLPIVADCCNPGSQDDWTRSHTRLRWPSVEEGRVLVTAGAFIRLLTAVGHEVVTMSDMNTELTQVWEKSEKEGE